MRLIVSLCVFAAGAFAGFFLTALVRLTPSDWYYWVGARAPCGNSAAGCGSATRWAA